MQQHNSWRTNQAIFFLLNYHFKIIETLILNGNTVTKTAFRARKVPGLSRNGSQEPYFYLYPFTQKENHTSILSAMPSTPLSKYYESSWYYKERVRLHLLMKNSQSGHHFFFYLILLETKFIKTALNQNFFGQRTLKPNCHK